MLQISINRRNPFMGKHHINIASYYSQKCKSQHLDAFEHWSLALADVLDIEISIAQLFSSTTTFLIPLLKFLGTKKHHKNSIQKHAVLQTKKDGRVLQLSPGYMILFLSHIIRSNVKFEDFSYYQFHDIGQRRQREPPERRLISTKAKHRSGNHLKCRKACIYIKDCQQFHILHKTNSIIPSCWQFRAFQFNAFPMVFIIQRNFWQSNWWFDNIDLQLHECR